MWVIGEFLLDVITDFFGLVIEVISASMSRKPAPPAGATPSGANPAGAPQAAAPTAPLPGFREQLAGRRTARDGQRGAAFAWQRGRIADIAFSRGELAGRRASELTTRRLRVLADSWPDRAVRLGIRSYLNAHRPGWRAPERGAPPSS